MEKADILEMSVQYLREMRKLEKSQNGKLALFISCTRLFFLTVKNYVH